MSSRSLLQVVVVLLCLAQGAEAAAWHHVSPACQTNQSPESLGEHPDEGLPTGDALTGLAGEPHESAEARAAPLAPLPEEIWHVPRAG